MFDDNKKYEIFMDEVFRWCFDCNVHLYLNRDSNDFYLHFYDPKSEHRKITIRL